jgi:hypothetical protein
MYAIVHCRTADGILYHTAEPFAFQVGDSNIGALAFGRSAPLVTIAPFQNKAQI